MPDGFGNRHDSHRHCINITRWFISISISDVQRGTLLHAPRATAIAYHKNHLIAPRRAGVFILPRLLSLTVVPCGLRGNPTSGAAAVPWCAPALRFTAPSQKLLLAPCRIVHFPNEESFKALSRSMASFSFIVTVGSVQAWPGW